jgi:hypothetical protein
MEIVNGTTFVSLGCPILECGKPTWMALQTIMEVKFGTRKTCIVSAHLNICQTFIIVILGTYI